MNTTRQPTIVVGVSGSRASAMALRWAADEAQRMNAQLRAVLIWDSKHRAPYAPPTGSSSPDQLQLEASRTLTAAVRAVFGSAPPATLTTEVCAGTAERALVDQSAGASLLVLGSASGMAAGRSIGPVIRTCLSRAHCPVVVVGPEDVADPIREQEELPVAVLAG